MGREYAKSSIFHFRSSAARLLGDDDAAPITVGQVKLLIKAIADLADVIVDNLK